MGRNDYLIKRKFYNYLVPGIMLVVAMQLGNIVDGILVSHLLNIDGMTAITLSLPVLLSLQLFGFVISVGGSVLASVELGKRNTDTASGIFSVSLLAGIVISAVLACTAPFLSHPLAVMLASTDRLVSLLEPYLLINIAFIPVLNLIMIIVNFIRIDNNPKLAAAAFIIANVVNLILDYVFLKFTNLEMYGASLSTMIGYGCGFAVLIPYIKSKNRMLKPSLKKAFAHLKMLGAVLGAGVTQGSMLLMQILQYLILNTMIQNTLGADKMAIYAICLNSVDIVRLFIEGVIGVVQTIAGVLYGEKDYYGIRKLSSRVLKTSVVVVLFLMAVFIVFPQAILAIFSFDKFELYDIAVLSVRLFSLSFMFFAFNFFTQTYYQTILKTSLSTINTVLQGFVLLIPISIGFMLMFDIQGICIAYTVTEILAFGITWLYRMIQQHRNKLPQKGFLMIPDIDSESYCDITIRGSEKEAVEASEKLIQCCLEHGMDKTKSEMIGIAVEEIAVNIARYGNLKYECNYIDINLSETENKLILRIRDDGVPFNPTEYQSQEEEGFLVGGIATIKKIADKLNYIRVLDLNNTVIELKK